MYTETFQIPPAVNQIWKRCYTLFFPCNAPKQKRTNKTHYKITSLYLYTFSHDVNSVMLVSKYHYDSPAWPSRMLLKRGTGSGERGAGNGERGTEVWERVVSGNLHKNPKWRSKKRERERRRQRKEFVPWLKSGGDEIANQTHILRLRFEQVVCFFDIQPVSFTIW